MKGTRRSAAVGKKGGERSTNQPDRSYIGKDMPGKPLSLPEPLKPRVSSRSVPRRFNTGGSKGRL